MSDWLIAGIIYIAVPFLVFNTTDDITVSDVLLQYIRHRLYKVTLVVIGVFCLLLSAVANKHGLVMLESIVQLILAISCLLYIIDMLLDSIASSKI